MILAGHEFLVVVRGIQVRACCGGSCFGKRVFRRKIASWGFTIVIDCMYFIVQEKQRPKILPDGSLRALSDSPTFDY